MPTPPTLEHLFTMTASTETAAVIPNGPNGTRVVVRAESGTFEGPKLKGSVQGPGGDWVIVRPSGAMALDVRLILKTDDDALIFMTYTGIGKDGGKHLRTTPRFETAAEQYLWLNDAVCVSTGAVGAGDVTYDVYQVL